MKIGHRNFITFLIISSFGIFTSCTQYQSVKPIGHVQTTFIISGDFPKVWDNLADVIIAESYQLDNTDKESGIITTKIKNLSGKVISQYTYHKYNELYKLLEEFEQENTFRIKKLKNGYTELKILSSFQGKRTNSYGGVNIINLKTNGHFELKLVNILKAKIII